MCWAWAALSGLHRKALLPRKRKIIYSTVEKRPSMYKDYWLYLLEKNCLVKREKLLLFEKMSSYKRRKRRSILR
jgi:hypothetical protein